MAVLAELGGFAHRNGEKIVAFQSGLERSFVQLCDLASAVAEMRRERFTLLFDDVVDERELRYTSDYRVDVASRLAHAERHSKSPALFATALCETNETVEVKKTTMLDAGRLTP